MLGARRAGIAIVLAVAVVACNSSTSKIDSRTGASAPVPDKSPLNVNVSVVKWPALESVLASHAGKVVVMDVWAEY
jgi:hypothetical protein